MSVWGGEGLSDETLNYIISATQEFRYDLMPYEDIFIA